MEKQDNQTLENKNLILASQKGDFEGIKKALENGADINHQEVDGWTVLMTATHSGEEKIVEFLLKNGADFELKEENGQTALELALEWEENEIFKLIQQTREIKWENECIEQQYEIYQESEEAMIDRHIEQLMEEQKFEEAMIDRHIEQLMEEREQEAYEEEMIEKYIQEQVKKSSFDNIKKVQKGLEKLSLKVADDKKLSKLLIEFSKSLTLRNNTPQKLVEILNKFTIAKSNLKHTTHNWDMEQRKEKWKDINGFIEDIKEDWKAIDDDLKNISPNLHSTIESFLFNTKLGEKNPESKQECIYSWGEHHLKMGWSSPEFIQWCNANPKESPFNYMLEKSKREVIDGVAIDRFSDVINIFKNEIEIRSDKNQLMEIFFNLEGNLANGFNLDINDSLEGVEFYTDVESFKESLVRIFKMMQERETSPQIKVRAKKFVDKGYIELYITQIASTTHKEPQEIIKKIEEKDAGDMGYILEKLSSLCDWSIEYPFNEEKSYRINLLDSKTHKISFKEVNPIEGFTHILRFYK